LSLDSYLDVFHASATREGEELCANAVTVVRTGSRLIAVLSDGIESGVKGSILATLTSTILVTMIDAGIPLKEVVATIIDTLPGGSSGRACVTFTILEVDQDSKACRITNFDNPPVIYCRKGQPVRAATRLERIGDETVTLQETALELGDSIIAISRGVLGSAASHKPADWETVARFLSGEALEHSGTAKRLVASGMDKVKQYRDAAADATILAICLRPRNSVMILTGPPLDPKNDAVCAARLLSFAGRKVICGGTTSQIVALQMGESVVTDNYTLDRKSVV
jgi:hypothetical protein